MHAEADVPGQPWVTGELESAVGILHRSLGQRTNAIARHLNEPLADAPAEVIDDSLLKALIDAATAAGLTLPDFQDVRNTVITWLHRTRVLEAARGFESLALLQVFETEFSLTLEKEHYNALGRPVAGFIDALRKRVDIGSQQVPVLVYTGDQTQLPEIFARLNRQGTTLSRYQIYAATWADNETKVVNEAIQDAIADKYAQLIAGGFELEEDPAVDPESASLFEYLYGFSRVLATTYPELFREAADTEEASTAFLIGTLVRGERLDQMAKLPTVLAPRNADGKIDPKAFENAILASADFVNTALKPYLGLRLAADAATPAHSELQMVSIVAAVAAHLYASTGDWRAKPKAKNVKARLEKAIPQHYLLDIVRQTWRGPLYTTAWDRVWDTSSGSLKPSTYYLAPPSKTTWDNSLRVWFDDQIAEQAERRPNVSASDKVFLKFVYGSVVTVADQAKYKFDVEHLFPVSRLLTASRAAAAVGWPISCIANLALLDRSTNRKKKDATLSEYFAKPTKKRGGGPTQPEKDLIKTFLFCDVNQVAIPQVGGKDAITRADYEAFLKLRWDSLRAGLYKALGVS